MLFSSYAPTGRNNVEKRSQFQLKERSRLNTHTCAWATDKSEMPAHT